jgi:hypothetical protein
MGSDVWYVGYGSNLSKQRFLCYIKGGTPQFGKKFHKGCKDPTPPRDHRQGVIPYPLYFALPEAKNGTANWGPGGVAFIGPAKDEKAGTLSSMWRITEGQYAEVKRQEGSWYNKQISLGKEEGIPVLPPSEAYLKTIALGLRETCKRDNEAIADYLAGKKGIKGLLSKDEILRVLAALRS